MPNSTKFQSTRVLQLSTMVEMTEANNAISIHESPATLDTDWLSSRMAIIIFQSTRVLQLSTAAIEAVELSGKFQSTRVLQLSTSITAFCSSIFFYFNPRESCNSRRTSQSRLAVSKYFNPRESCNSRLSASDWHRCNEYFNPRESCNSRRKGLYVSLLISISIHESPATLDSKILPN